jgi:hypothetical protein
MSGKTKLRPVGYTHFLLFVNTEGVSPSNPRSCENPHATRAGFSRRLVLFHRIIDLKAIVQPNKSEQKGFQFKQLPCASSASVPSWLQATQRSEAMRTQPGERLRWAAH